MFQFTMCTSWFMRPWRMFHADFTGETNHFPRMFRDCPHCRQTTCREHERKNIRLSKQLGLYFPLIQQCPMVTSILVRNPGDPWRRPGEANFLAEPLSPESGPHRGRPNWNCSWENSGSGSRSENCSSGKPCAENRDLLREWHLDPKKFEKSRKELILTIFWIFRTSLETFGLLGKKILEEFAEKFAGNSLKICQTKLKESLQIRSGDHGDQKLPTSSADKM